jgi:hypothetical protein
MSEVPENKGYGLKALISAENDYLLENVLQYHNEGKVR